jgi:Tol biopolymer transport system component
MRSLECASGGRNDETRRNIFSIAALALFVAVTGTLTLAQKSNSPEVLLQRAIQKEMVDGDLKGAIELYKKVMTAAGVSPRTAADALVHIGLAYERTGDVEARKAYERVMREYSGQAEAVTTAQRRLAGLNLKQQPEGLTARLICRDCGDSDGSVASNGTLMATTDWENGGIILRDLSTGRVTKISTGSSAKDSIAFPLSPVLSRDARSIAYRVSMSGTQDKLYVIGREAGAKPILMVDDPAFRGISPAGWSPDSKSVLVKLRNADSTSQLAWVSVLDRKIKTLPWRVEGVISHPTISPDGRYIAYAAAKNAALRSSTQAPSGRHIYVVASEGSGKEEEVVREAGNDSPSWTPDGKHILFLSDRSNNIGLWSVAVQNGRVSGRPARLRPNTGRIDPLELTIGDSYYYTLDQSPYDEIFIGDVRSGTLQASLSSGESTPGGQTPGWSLDGKFIAFSRLRFGEPNAYDAVVRTVETGVEKVYRHNGLRNDLVS